MKVKRFSSALLFLSGVLHGISILSIFGVFNIKTHTIVSMVLLGALMAFLSFGIDCYFRVAKNPIQIRRRSLELTTTKIIIASCLVLLLITVLLTK